MCSMKQWHHAKEFAASSGFNSSPMPRHDRPTNFKLAAELDDAKSVIVAQSAGLRMLRERVTTLEGENERLRAELDELSRSK